MSICQHKHTKYQPTNEEWRCPRCGATAEQGFIIYESINDMDNIECELLHPEDYLHCGKCGLDTSGKAFAAFVVKKNSLVVCPTCKGKGMVNKDTDHATEIERLTAERDALKSCLASHDSHGPDGRNVTNSQFIEMRSERDAAVRERDAAVEALQRIIKLDVRHDDESNNCEAWGMHLEEAVDVARAALVKIEGDRNVQDV